MGWVIFIIILVVGVASHLMSLKQNQPQPKPPPPGGNPQGRARPTTSEIDRFLEEVNRRKQQQQQERRLPPPPVQREPLRPQRPVAPKPVKVTQRQVVLAEPIVPAIVVGEPIIESQHLAEIPIIPLGQLPNINVPPTLAQRVDSPVVQQAKVMLKTRDNLRSVFVLNEILGQPRCRRPFPGHLK